MTGSDNTNRRLAGPVTIGETVFLKVKRCRLCNLCNTDRNPIREGPSGVEERPFVIWGRGPCTDPTGRFCKVCMLTYTIGGFSSEHPDVDRFIVSLKESRQLHQEWDAGREGMIVFLGVHGVQRLKGPTKTAAGKSVDVERTKVVQAYSRNELKVIWNFRGALAADFEKKHPGLIRKMNLRSVETKLRGKPSNVVLNPKARASST